MIDNITLSNDNKFVVVHSNHGTIHIFTLNSTSINNKTGLFTSMMNSVTSFFGKEIISEYACASIENISKNENVQMMVLPPTESQSFYQLFIVSNHGEIFMIEFYLQENQLTIKKQSMKSIQFN